MAKPQEAETEFKKAIELDKGFSEAHNNLGTFYLARSRYADAAREFELALSNDLYRERVVAETNLGWALYKSGQADKGVQRIKGALAVNPRYCLGWRQLGTIHSEQGNLGKAAEAFQSYAATCPDTADAHLQLGKLFARQGKASDARAEFEKCGKTADARDERIRAECQRLRAGRYRGGPAPGSAAPVRTGGPPLRASRRVLPPPGRLRAVERALARLRARGPGRGGVRAGAVRLLPLRRADRRWPRRVRSRRWRPSL